MSKNLKNNYKSLITNQLNTLTYENLETIFSLYMYLNPNYNFFMPEQTHINFINLYLDTPCNRIPITFKSLIILLTTEFTLESKYPTVIQTIEMIKNNYSFEQIINTLLYS